MFIRYFFLVLALSSSFSARGQEKPNPDHKPSESEAKLREVNPKALPVQHFERYFAIDASDGKLTHMKLKVDYVVDGGEVRCYFSTELLDAGGAEGFSADPVSKCKGTADEDSITILAPNPEPLADSDLLVLVLNKKQEIQLLGYGNYPAVAHDAKPLTHLKKIKGSFSTSVDADVYPLEFTFITDSLTKPTFGNLSYEPAEVPEIQANGKVQLVKNFPPGFINFLEDSAPAVFNPKDGSYRLKYEALPMPAGFPGGVNPPIPKGTIAEVIVKDGQVSGFQYRGNSAINLATHIVGETAKE